jgi:multidrug efflux pump subunit AcrA (membrane-fusion protein)
VNALPGRIFNAWVSRTSGNLSANFRTEAVEIDISNDKDEFKPGMYAEVTLPVENNKNAFIIPKLALVNSTERKYVVLNVKGKAAFKDVISGNQNYDSIEVFGDLNEGDVYVSNPDEQLKEGTDL